MPFSPQTLTNPSSTKNAQVQRKIAIRRQVATNQRTTEALQSLQQPIQTIQNITNYHIDMPQQIIVSGEEVRSLDRIID
jgi:Skp family chaperone for outer membrane proteins